MKLATKRNGSRDGRLLVVSRNGLTAMPAPEPWLTMQNALDAWGQAEPVLLAIFTELNADPSYGHAVDLKQLCAPLPRAYEWLDASAFLNHVRLVRQARGVAAPESLEGDPLIYQGGSGDMLGPHENFLLRNESWGLDFEAEVCAILGDVPQGISAADAACTIRLLTIVNDWTLRNLVPEELAKGFGFVQSKPATAFAPFAVTPDELANAWSGGRAHLEMRVTYNGQTVGSADTGPEMHFSFFDLIAHIAKTRRFCAGTLLGSGTISNVDPSRGFSCLAEQRTRQTIAHGKPLTPFMSPGDTIRIEAFAHHDGMSPFGAIDQTVVAATAADTR